MPRARNFSDGLRIFHFCPLSDNGLTAAITACLPTFRTDRKLVASALTPRLDLERRHRNCQWR
jgi:hypothetical protein